MHFHYERLRVPDVPFIVMEDMVFSDGQLWTVFHDATRSGFGSCSSMATRTSWAL